MLLPKTFLLSIAGLAGTSAVFGQQPIKTLLVFGDSFSDNGNVHAITGYPAEPYFGGRYTNGKTWVEYMAESLNAELVDRAYGGALVSKSLHNLTTTADGEFVAPDMYEQLSSYLNSTKNSTTKLPDPTTTVYPIFISGNDYVQPFSRGIAPNPPAIVGKIVEFIQTLHESPLGATRILLLNMFDFARLPVVQDAATRQGPPATQFILEGAHNGSVVHNALLTQRVQDLVAAKKGLKVDVVDFFGLVDKVVKDPKGNGFANATHACVTLAPGVELEGPYRSKDAKNVVECDKPDEFWFWDDQHPTTKAHKKIAEVAIAALAITTNNNNNNNTRGNGNGAANATTTDAPGHSAGHSLMVNAVQMLGGLAVSVGFWLL
ncbi:hypothetical protein DFJ77DRAFT_552038 [Powellomyces hirtus]|nr:hypothetical protein DFJ77DRAFT_552038 [Powellomyces hirtus]